jgi:Protein of unknown function (DUF3089)
MARKFLYVVAILIGLVIASAIAYRLFGVELFRLAMVPGAEFEALTPRTPADYADAKLWLARPDIKGDPSHWLPDGVSASPAGDAAIFFVHPTSYINPASWNAPPEDDAANRIAVNLVKGQGSALATAGAVWAPRYRQAAIGSFLTDKPEAKRAHEAAYGDALAAFDAFVAQVPPDQPIILAGHSQGSFHLVRLMHERVAGKPIAGRIVAAWLIGWPVSIEADIPAMGLPACATPASANCILAWQSFAAPADASAMQQVFNTTPGMTGKSRKGTHMLCSNPQVSGVSGTTPLNFELGPKGLERVSVAARCDTSGLLIVSNPPNLGAGVMPGNNWHVYDYALFWEAMRADAARRLAAFKAR